jgi:hypothetical protein
VPNFHLRDISSLASHSPEDVAGFAIDADRSGAGGRSGV